MFRNSWISFHLFFLLSFGTGARSQVKSSWTSELPYPKAAYVHHGHQLFLSCFYNNIIKGLPETVEYAWKDQQNNTLTDSRTRVLKTGTLVISDAQPQDEGLYYCMLSHMDHPIRMFMHRVFVFSPPHFEQEAILLYDAFRCNNLMEEHKLLYIREKLCQSRRSCPYLVTVSCMQVKNKMKLGAFVRIKPRRSFKTPECDPECIKKAVIAHLDKKFDRILKLAKDEEEETKSSRKLKFKMDTGFLKATRLSCDAGYYCQAKLICLPCPVGSYAPKHHNKCLACPENTFQHLAAQRQCLPCPDDGTTDGKRANSSLACTGAHEIKLHAPGVLVQIDNSGHRVLIITIAVVLGLAAIAIIVALVMTVPCPGKDPDVPFFMPDPITEHFLRRAKSSQSSPSESNQACEPLLAEGNRPSPKTTTPVNRSCTTVDEEGLLPIRSAEATDTKSRPRPKSNHSSGSRKDVKNHHISSHSSLWDDYSALERAGTTPKRHSSIRVDDWIDSVRIESAAYADQFQFGGDKYDRDNDGMEGAEAIEEPIYANIVRGQEPAMGDPIYANIVGEQEPVYENLPLERSNFDNQLPGAQDTPGHYYYQDRRDAIPGPSGIGARAPDLPGTDTSIDHVYDSVPEFDSTCTSAWYDQQHFPHRHDSDAATYTVESPLDLLNIPQIAPFPGDKVSAKEEATSLYRKRASPFGEGRNIAYTYEKIKTLGIDVSFVPIAPPPPPFPNSALVHPNAKVSQKKQSNSNLPSEERSSECTPVSKVEKPPVAPKPVLTGLKSEIKESFARKLGHDLIPAADLPQEESYRKVMERNREAHSKSFKSKQTSMHGFLRKAIAVHKAKDNFLVANHKKEKKRQNELEKGGSSLQASNNNSNSLDRRISRLSQDVDILN